MLGRRAGDMVVSIALFFFAFTTIMAYYYYAETNLVYLFNRWRRRQYRKHPERLEELERADMYFGDDRGEKIVIWILRTCTITAVFIGSMAGSGVAWTVGPHLHCGHCASVADDCSLESCWGACRRRPS